MGQICHVSRNFRECDNLNECGQSGRVVTLAMLGSNLPLHPGSSDPARGLFLCGVRATENHHDATALSWNFVLAMTAARPQAAGAPWSDRRGPPRIANSGIAQGYVEGDFAACGVR